MCKITYIKNLFKIIDFDSKFFSCLVSNESQPIMIYELKKKKDVRKGCYHSFFIHSLTLTT